MVANGDASPPAQADVSALLDAAFNAKTSNDSINASYALCEMLLGSSAVGYRGLESFGVVAEIKKAAADKKSGLRRESAQNLLGALFEKFPARQPISEVIFLMKDGGLVACALDALADKGAVVRDAAQYGLDALFNHLSPEALVVGLRPTSFRWEWLDVVSVTMRPGSDLIRSLISIRMSSSYSYRSTSWETL